MAGKKRKVSEDFEPKSRQDIAELLEKARATVYVRQPELALRDAGLLAFEYCFVTRVSEGVGRTYPENKREQAKAILIDTYAGVMIDDFKTSDVKGTKVLRCRFRVLKRGRKKKTCPSCQKRNALDSVYCRFCGVSLTNAKVDYTLNPVFVWDSARLDDPFTTYITDWLDYLKDKGRKGRVFAITRQRAWQIMNQLGIMNHTQRHWRATDLADVMDPFMLKEALHRATIPFEYVHRAEKQKLDKEKQLIDQSA